MTGQHKRSPRHTTSGAAPLDPVAIKDVRRARAAMQRAEAEFRRTVSRAIDQRDPKLAVKDIAEAAGLTKARCYQIRNETRLE